MSTTLATLRTIGYNILREEQDSTAYPLSLMDLMINSAYQSICNGRVVNPLTKEEVRKGQLPFLNTNAFYSNVQTTSLDADTTVGAVTLSVADASDFPTSGYLYIGGNLITYTGTTATSFTGVTGVLFAFESGMEVSIAFALPTDYASVINIIYDNKFKLPGKQYDDIFEDLNSRKGSYVQRNRADSLYSSPYSIKPFYVIIGDYIVMFNVNNTGGMINLRYEKMPTALSASTDAVIIDNDVYAQSTIPYLAIGEMLYNRGEEGRAAEILNYGIGKVREMYNYYNNSSFESINGTQYKVAKGKLNI